MKPLRALLVVLLSIPFFAQSPSNTPPEPDWDAAGAAWWSHVQYLADDKLQGRLPGTPGFESATQYVVNQFKAIGLKPAGTNGFLQPIKLLSFRTDDDKSSVELVSADKHAVLKPGKEITLSPHVASGSAVDAPLVFIGYGLHLPSKHIDDLAGLDLHGKVVVLYNGAPSKLQGPLRAYARMPAQRWKTLKAAGAIGIISINPPRPLPGPAPTPGSAAPTPPPAPEPRPTILFADQSLDTLTELRVNATVLPKNADKLLGLSDHTMAELQPLIDAGKPLPTFDMNTTLHVTTIAAQNPPIDTQNIVGKLEGSDPRLEHEFIIISAHLDHLGVGKPVNGDAIYNGAMDNASGIASVIEAAKLLAAGPRPKRSILFIALTAEEMGELGSAYFAAKPTVDKSNIVADLNMDMFLPLFPLRYLEVQGLGESTLGNDIRAIAQLNDVEVQFDKQPDENRFIRSDQVNFVSQGIPALAFKFGWTPDSPEMKTFNDFVKVRYHKPSDDLNQPVDKAAAAQFTQLLAELAARVANAPQRPSWYPESSFAHQIE
jgi:hypothetical protein